MNKKTGCGAILFWALLIGITGAISVKWGMIFFYAFLIISAITIVIMLIKGEI